MGARPAGPVDPAWRELAARTIGRVNLAKGRQVRIRPVAAADTEAWQAFVEGLSPRSRLLRFHGGVRQLPGSVVRAMASPDIRGHVALVAESAGADGARRLVADARYVRDPAERSEAEFAVAVADDWQGAGLGREMLRRLLHQARHDGIAALQGEVLPHNEAMLALLRSMGARLRTDSADPRRVRATLTV